MNVLIVNFPTSNHIARLHVMRLYLQVGGAQVKTISCSIWGDNDKRLKLTKRPWLILLEILPMIRYLREIVREVRTGKHDKIIIGYPAYLDVLVLNTFCRKYRSRFYTDYFLSVYDTAVLDRKMHKPRSIMAKLFFGLDRWLIRASNRVLTDTHTNSKRYSTLFGANLDKFMRYFVGSRLLLNGVATNDTATDDQSTVNVGWVGSFIPLHGIGIILQTALQMKDKNVRFHLIGNGQDFETAQEFLRKNKLNKVVLHGKCSYDDSMHILKSCTVCLGIFGGSEKSKSVIPFKVFDYLYLGKSIITQASPAFEEMNNNPQIQLTSAEPADIADAILTCATTETNEFDLDALMRDETVRFMQNVQA